MLSLNSHLSKVVDSLKKIGATSQVFGLVTLAKNNDGVVYFNVDKNAITLNDDSEVFIYNKYLSESFDILPGRGKSNKYKKSAQIELICYSKKPVYDQVELILSHNSNITLQSLNTDSKQIFKNETGQDMFDVAKYLFSLKYGFAYHSETCTTCVDACKR